MPYEERVPAATWFRWAVRLLGIVPLSVALFATFLADETAQADQVGLGFSVVFTALVALFLDRWLMVLQVSVEDGVVQARFGPFRKRLTASEVTGAADVPYRWLQYGGWGIRGLGNRRAWSVPFLKTGVEFTMRDGKRYFISSRTPRPFLEAVQQITEQSGRTRG